MTLSFVYYQPVGDKSYGNNTSDKAPDCFDASEVREVSSNKYGPL